MLFTINEIIDIIIMTLALGFIFQDVFKKKVYLDSSYDPIKSYAKEKKSFFSEDYKFAMMVTAPAVILHELGHKFVAIAFGATATFQAAYLFLGIAVLLKLMKSSFIFFVPAYVAWQGTVSSLDSSVIAFAGPFVNLFLFLFAYSYIRSGKTTTKTIQFWNLFKKINLFLFGFNMLPIPGFDGYHVFVNLFRFWTGLF
jgi:Zn-dependent protease